MFWLFFLTKNQVLLLLLLAPELSYLMPSLGKRQNLLWVLVLCKPGQGSARSSFWRPERLPSSGWLRNTISTAALH